MNGRRFLKQWGIIMLWLGMNTISVNAKTIALIQKVTNSHERAWFLGHFIVRDHGDYVLSDGITLAPKSITKRPIMLHNIPEVWPENTQKTHIGRWKLAKNRQYLSHAAGQLDVFAHSDQGQLIEWRCESPKHMACAVAIHDNSIILDITITAG